MAFYAVNTDVGIYLFDNPDSAVRFKEQVDGKFECIQEIYPGCMLALNDYQGRKVSEEMYKEHDKLMEEYYSQF